MVGGFLTQRFPKMGDGELVDCALGQAEAVAAGSQQRGGGAFRYVIAVRWTRGAGKAIVTSIAFRTVASTLIVWRSFPCSIWRMRSIG